MVGAALLGLLTGLAALRAADPTPQPPDLESAPQEVASPRSEFAPQEDAARFFKELYPSPTDDLMAPSPAVPPRRAYQRPEMPPIGSPPNDIPLPIIPEGTPIPIPQSEQRDFRFIRRYGLPYQLSSELMPDKQTRRWVITGGVIVSIAYPQPGGPPVEIEFATDNAVIWTRGASVDVGSSFTSGPSSKVEVELYLMGNVVIRTRTMKPMPLLGRRDFLSQTLRADQVYYDVERNRAIALDADLEFFAPVLPDSVHMRGREIWRLGVDDWQVQNADLFSSKLPADPGLKITMPNLTLHTQQVVPRNIFGFPYRDLATGQTLPSTQQMIVTAQNSRVEVLDVPVFYIPYLKTDAMDPLGPFVGIGLGVSRMFGTQVSTTWDMYKLLALKGPPRHRWLLNLDYLSDRGPAAGTTYDYQLPGLSPEGDVDPRFPSRGNGFVKLYGINDKGLDILGGDRGPQPQQPLNRGRFAWRHNETIDTNWVFQGQVAAVSDLNFLEQYYKYEWDTGANQETFAYLTWQDGIIGASGLLEPKLGRSWIGETMSVPRFRGEVIGKSFFDLLTYNVQGEAGYFLARPSEQNPFPVLPTDQRIDAGRFDLNQELSIPFGLGPLKVVPYAKIDLTQYTDTLTGDAQGRFIGGGGLRTSLPLSRLYDDVHSDIFNVNSIYHKAVLSANYRNLNSNVPYSDLPYLDRLNDDAIDQGYRNMRVFESIYYPGPSGTNLQFGQQFDPQRMAIRRLTDTAVDSRDSIDVLQLDLRQRWQTKRGYAGFEHIVDLAVLDLSGSFFPNADRDNFGNPWSFLEYDFLYNVGDRTSFVSSGWFEPYNTGSRFWNVGAYLDRPDRTNVYLGYRQTDPLNSKAVTAIFGYQMSRKYFTNFAVTYDFGLQSALSNTLSLTRTGADLTFTFGITYNALVNNFGVQFMVLPNLVAATMGNRFGLGGLAGR